MADAAEVLRTHTTEPFVVLQLGEEIPTTEGTLIPLVIAYGNGIDVETAAMIVANTAQELMRGRVELRCGDPSHDHATMKEELLHARREPPYGG